MKPSAVLYAIVIAAFFMPFFVVSCQQTELISIKGIQLVIGGEAKSSMGEMLSGLGQSNEKLSQNQKVKPNPLAIAAFAIAVLCIILVLALPNRFYLIPAFISLAGVICLLVLKSGMMDYMASAQTGMDPTIDLKKVLVVRAKTGFWIANISFILGGMLTTFLGLVNGGKETFNYAKTTASHGYEHLKPIPPLEPIISAETINQDDELVIEPEQTEVRDSEKPEI